MKSVIASAASIGAIVHALFLAIPAIQLVNLWATDAASPPTGEQMVIALATLLMVLADAILATTASRFAFQQIRSHWTILGMPFCIYPILIIVFFAYSGALEKTELLATWVEAVWKFLVAGLVLCALVGSTAVAARQRVT